MFFRSNSIIFALSGNWQGFFYLVNISTMTRERKKIDQSLDDRYNSVNVDLSIPENILLPDGREFNIPALLANSRQNHEYGTLKSFQNQTERRVPQGRFNAKYTPEEIAWMLTATLEDVEAKYEIDRKAALGILRYVYKKVGRIYKTPTRKPDRRTHPD